MRGDSLLGGVALVAGKDLRIEARSRVATAQIAPFALLVLVLFAFALEPDRGVLEQASAGLFWLAVAFATVLAVQRSFSLEADDGALDGLRLAGVDPAAVFAGKALGIGAQLLVLELLLAAGAVVLYGTEPAGLLLIGLTALAATAGLAASGCVYGVLSAGARVKETLLPLLYVPVMAPIVLGATRATEAALAGVAADGWPWLRLLAAFAVIEVAAGALAFGALWEDA